MTTEPRGPQREDYTICLVCGFCLWVRSYMLTKEGQLHMTPCSKCKRDTGAPFLAWSTKINCRHGRLWQEHREATNGDGLHVQAKVANRRHVDGAPVAAALYVCPKVATPSQQLSCP